MNRRIVCPRCAEAEELVGASSPDGIEITCERCGTRWLRDQARVRCATCGSDDLEYRPQASTSYSRGNQVSIVGWRHVPLCAACDAPMLVRSLAGKPIPYQYRPAALDRRDPGDGPQAEPDIVILPR